ncbi:hypothetical protein [Eilatimonas milleporae]|uniref:5-bromo-4-chloroindolyl phosphate hydrolysis protein n=1 Tax=Eilatimonas milleporae TaxID=911205 RepID=A0A3M0BYD3_9PROT|nr:hypothetical protein [Eilatimonas milleporae]RMB01457.1 hypothetical protein BXY39_3641 [Eilatimonas milleporae]
MQIASRLLVAMAFLTGAFLAVLDPLKVQWPFFLPVIGVGVLGIVLLHRARHSARHHDGHLMQQSTILETSLDNIATTLAGLADRKEAIPTYDMRFEIDRSLRHDLMAFADARESMKQLFGLRAYADIMSSFAAGERYVNRVWSASTDGYVDEVLSYIVKARDQFAHAKAEYDKAKTRTAAQTA